MIRQILEECVERPAIRIDEELERLAPDAPTAVARLITWFEARAGSESTEAAALRQLLETRRAAAKAPVIGITGTGGAGKSTLVDELVRRFRREFPSAASASSRWTRRGAARAVPCWATACA